MEQRPGFRDVLSFQSFENIPKDFDLENMLKDLDEISNQEGGRGFVGCRGNRMGAR